MKSSVYTWVAFGFMAVMGVFGMYLVGKGVDCTGVDCTKYSLMGWFCLFFVFGIIFYLWWRDRKKQKIPFHKIKSHYINEMEDKEKISINPLSRVWKLTEEGERYVFVLRSMVDDLPHYYMCEADMYEGSLGRGFGSWTNKQVEAMYWYQTRKKTDIQRAITTELKNQLARDVVLKGQQQRAALKQYQGGQE